VLLFFTLFEIIAVFGMGSLKAAFLVTILFLIHQAAESMLYFCLDINLEQETKIEGVTGSKRGMFLTIQNVAWVISPLAISTLVTAGHFSKVYFLSGAALIPLFLIAAFLFKGTKRTTNATSNILAILGSLSGKRDQVKIIGVQFILNFFYSWMIIYLPLLLSSEIGFGWDKIGVMFTIMLLPFLIFELPAGLLGDKKFGEKEILVLGFLIMFFATLVIPTISSPIFWLWALVLFGTRIGASLVEISSESYFFKHVKETDVGPISLFRMARPLSFILAPLIAIPVISFFSYSSSFYFLAFFTLLGLLFTPKVDTR
jgi:hypothetical protein